jgi:predicted RNase H-like HicB family nuclease
MQRQFTLEYWIDDSWYVGQLREVPGVFSQGESIDGLEENIRDAYSLLMEQASAGHPGATTKNMIVDVEGQSAGILFENRLRQGAS